MMAYGDGGFYFLQPVGNGYSGVEVMLNPGYGATGGSRSGGSTDPLKLPFTATQFERIVKKFGEYTKALYKKAWGFAALTKERKAAEKAWAEADRALGQLRVMKGSLKLSKWTYNDLPYAVRTGIGSWILANVLKVAAAPSVRATIPTVTPISPPRLLRQTLGARRDTTSPLAPSGDVMTLEMPVETTVMGPQAAATDEETALLQAQADLSEQAAQTVSTATDAAGGGVGVAGLLSTTTGKVVAGTAVAGVAYLLWRNRRSIFGS